MKNSNVTCNSCGYPLNGDRKYCKVCGNNLRENKKVIFDILKPSQIVAIVFLGFALVIGVIGLFGQIDQWVLSGNNYNLYGTTGIQWFFRDGWKNLLDSQSLDDLVINGVQFGFEFTTFLIGAIGSILLLIIYIQSLIRRARYKHTNFCTMKFFKYFVMLTLPYVFMISFFRTNIVFAFPESDGGYHQAFGWGPFFVLLANLLAFVAGCISHIACPCKKEEKAPFALKQLGIISLILFIVIGFGAATTITYVFSDETGYFVSYGIYDYIATFISVKSVPTTVGASFIATAGLALASLVGAIAYIFTKNNSRRIAYGTSVLVFNITALVLNYLGTKAYFIDGWGEEYLSNASFVSPTFIVTTILAFAAFTFAIIYGAIGHKHNARKVVSK